MKLVNNDYILSTKLFTSLTNNIHLDISIFITYTNFIKALLGNLRVLAGLTLNDVTKSIMTATNLKKVKNHTKVFSLRD